MKVTANGMPSQQHAADAEPGGNQGIQAEQQQQQQQQQGVAAEMQANKQQQQQQQQQQHQQQQQGPDSFPFTVKEDAQPLFRPLQLGRYRLSHRIVMAPLTRNRAPGTVSMPAMATYYSQRATAGGLIISEATCISQQGQGYLNVPGIHSQEQVQAWRQVTAAVHAKDGIFFCQLWHVGSVSHPDYQPDGGLPVSPSGLPIPEGFTVVTPAGRAALMALRSMEPMDTCLISFGRTPPTSALMPTAAAQENKARLILEVMEAAAAAIGQDRLALRLSPYTDNRSIRDDSIQRAIDKNVWLVQLGLLL
ncbi:hypothetical protein OEZ85_005628 [Tetradesmus obliquus]|uniref:NADH:flavin oxidoreductase/NADH oxidase N-terminal domain-containing protein n=1 Tax=Tetradesmus obliquus TaxID=3088 RepID=A0ABY8UH04_TETOB|nr:hypothetical protein OEZ85_005628 [Tetradesmus obliquus]